MERILTKSLTHRSRSPKRVTKQPLAAEGVTRRWLTEVEKGSNTSHVCNREMNASESPFKVSKAQLARQNITFETRDGQARRIFGYRSCVCRYRGGMNRLQAFHRNVGEPKGQYKGASEIKEASGRKASGIRQRKGELTEYLWQSDKSIVVMKAAKVAGAKGLGYCSFTQ